MMRIKVTIDRKQLREFEKEIGAYNKKLKKQIEIVTNKTARAVSSDIAGQIYKTLNATKGRIKKQINIDKASAKGLRGRSLATARVRIKHEKRLRLADFKPRQTKRGVSYRINRAEGVSRIDGAFMGPTPKVKLPRWDGGVRRRIGGPRTPHVELMGVSPWGVFVKRRLRKPITEMARERYRREIESRLRYIRLKKQGAI